MMMVPFWFALKLLGFLRVPAEQETLGLDESYHGEAVYSMDAIPSETHLLSQAGCWA